MEEEEATDVMVDGGKELLELAQAVPQASEAGLARLSLRFTTVLNIYREQSELLDPLLEDITTALTVGLSEAAKAPAFWRCVELQRTAPLLWTLASTRGYKTVGRFMPNEVALLPRVLAALQEFVLQDMQSVTGGPGATANWEGRCVLLMWLGTLVMTPFPLSTIDPSSRSRLSPAEEAAAVCRHYLQAPGSECQLAVHALGRLLTRPDTVPTLKAFVAWAPTAVLGDRSRSALLLLPGIIAALSAVLKAGRQEAVYPVALRLMAWVPDLFDESAGLSSGARRLLVKLATRAVLALCPVSTLDSQEADLGPMGDQLEVVMAALLQTLSDRDTVVRWSAAKGVGLLTSRLPADAVDDVLGTVIQTYGEAGRADEASRHGCCLALAEMARRALVPGPRLPDLLPVAQAALHYDVRKGSQSLGGSVRDAAAYLCWAVARGYRPPHLLPFVTAAAPALLTAAALDREVSCRRAAAAAFQEAVGRLGDFPDGLALLRTADYFSLSVRPQAYLTVAPQLAAFPGYHRPLAEALLRDKMGHWDASLRRLAARSLALMVPLDVPWYAQEALPVLLGNATNAVLEVRHGALLGAAELLPALARQGAADMAPCYMAKAAGLVAAVQQALFLRGKGADLMREALCRLVECIAEAGLPLSEDRLTAHMAFLEQQLERSSEAVFIAASAALRTLSRTYLVGTQAVGQTAAQTVGQTVGQTAGQTVGQQLVQRLLQKVRGGQPSQVRGGSAGLAALPGNLLCGELTAIITALREAIYKPGDRLSKEQASASIESRVAAAAALATVVVEADQCSAGGGNQTWHSFPDTQPDRVIVPVLLLAMQDYTSDNRGDVGSWLRGAAMGSLARVLPVLARWLPPDRVARAVQSAVGAVLKQAVERISTVRKAAGVALSVLLEADPPLPGIPERASLADALSMLGPVGCASLKALPRLACLLHSEDLMPDLAAGLTYAAGSRDRRVAAAASAAIAAQLTDPPGHPGDAARQTTEGHLTARMAAYFASCAAEHRSRGPQEQQVLEVHRQHDLPSLLCGVQLLITHGGMDRASQPTLDHLLAVLECRPLKLCKDMAWLHHAGTTLCQLLSPGGPHNPRILSAVETLLVCRFPLVRAYVAQQLYLQILAQQEREEQAKVALSALGAHSWDGLEMPAAQLSDLVEAVRVVFD